MAETSDRREYTVLVNDEEQYSLWMKGKAVPAGWRPAGKVGTLEECKLFVDEVWTDMRPLSLRKRMASLTSGDQGALKP